jgi:predicted DNA-binding transcriptional regulator AlpA
MDLLPPLSSSSKASSRETRIFSVSCPDLDPFVGIREVEKFSDFCKSEIYKQVKARTFPAPVPISKGRVAWLTSELIEWQRTRLAARRTSRTEVAAA